MSHTELHRRDDWDDKCKDGAPSDGGSSTPTTPPAKEVIVNPDGPEPDEDYVYPGTMQAIIVVVALGMTAFLTALDRTILSTAVPKITDEFHSLNDAGWYGTAYLITSCVLLLFFGRIYTFYSPKLVFFYSLAIFLIGSAICGAATNSAAFIVGRAISGIGCAGITDGNIVLVAYTVPLRQRPAVNAAMGLTFGAASIMGPFIGGVFTSEVSWRWCFYINLPLGGAALAVTMFLVKPTPTHAPDISFKRQLILLDPAGTVFSIAALSCLILGLQWGGTTYTWSDAPVIAVLVVFAVFWTAFILVQYFFNDVSSIPSRIVKNRDVLAGMLFSFCHGGGLFTIIYYVPMYFQAVKGVSAIKSGIMLFPMVIALVIGIISGGILTGVVGYYVQFAYICCIFTAVGCGLIGTWQPDTHHAVWIGFQVLVGLGYGWGFQIGIIAAQSSLPRNDIAMGSSLQQFSRLLGGTIFVAVGQNLLTTRLANRLPAVILGLSRQALGTIGSTELRQLVEPGKLPEFLKIYSDALHLPAFTAAGVSAAMIISCVMLRWHNVKDPKLQGGLTVKENEAKLQKEQQATEKAVQDV